MIKIFEHNYDPNKKYGMWGLIRCKVTDGRNEWTSEKTESQFHYTMKMNEIIDKHPDLETDIKELLNLYSTYKDEEQAKDDMGEGL